MPNLRRDENGIGQALIIVIIVVVLAVAGGIIWQSTKKNSNTTTGTAISKPVVSSTCLQSFKDNALCAFAEHTNISSQQYVAKGTATLTNGTTSTFTVLNDGKGNTEVTYSSAGKQISSIRLNGVGYVQGSPGSSWLEYSNAGVGQATATPNPTSGFNLNFTTATPKDVMVTKQGTVACGSLTCKKYRVAVSSEPSGIQYVYFDTKDYMLRQWTSTNPSNGIDVNLTFNYQPITITKPSPIQKI
jgi:hypothetical protein